MDDNKVCPSCGLPGLLVPEVNHRTTLQTPTGRYICVACSEKSYQRSLSFSSTSRAPFAPANRKQRRALAAQNRRWMKR